MKTRILCFVFTLCLILLAACREVVNTDQPPPITYGADVCERCGMIISDERFAAAYWTEDGQAHRFDDVGGMFAHYQEAQEAVARFWVHDFIEGGWLPAEDAYFVLDPQLASPMGFGMVACADEAQAKALAYGQEGAAVMPFTRLMAELDAGTLVLDPARRRQE